MRGITLLKPDDLYSRENESLCSVQVPKPHPDNPVTHKASRVETSDIIKLPFTADEFTLLKFGGAVLQIEHELSVSLILFCSFTNDDRQAARSLTVSAQRWALVTSQRWSAAEENKLLCIKLI